MVTVEPGAYLIPPLLAKAAKDPKAAPLLNLEAAEALVRSGLGGVRIEDNVAYLGDDWMGQRAGGAQGDAQRAAARAAAHPAAAAALAGGVQGRLMNLTVAAGVVKGLAEVEGVMRQEWRPEEGMAAQPSLAEALLG